MLYQQFKLITGALECLGPRSCTFRIKLKFTLSLGLGIENRLPVRHPENLLTIFKNLPCKPRVVNLYAYYSFIIINKIL